MCGRQGFSSYAFAAEDLLARRAVPAPAPAPVPHLVPSHLVAASPAAVVAVVDVDVAVVAVHGAASAGGYVVDAYAADRGTPRGYG